MDNLTHSLCGWTLARAGLNRGGRWVTPFLIVLANLPDLEPVLLPGRPPGAYLLYHRGLTHSVLMLVVDSIVFGALLWILERRIQLPYWKAAGICAAGLFSHLLLDALNNYGVRPALPFDSTWYYGDMVFIVEPLIWLMFGLPLFLGSQLDRGSAAAWFAGAGLTTMLVGVGIGRNLMPWPVLLVWLGALGLAIGIRLRRQLPSERCAQTGLLVLALYLIVLFTASRAALERGKAELEAAIPGSNTGFVRASVLPHPAQPWRYDVFVQTNTTLSQVSIDFLGTDTVVPGSVNLNLNDPALDTIRSTFEYRAWKCFARHPYALRRGNVLILGDMRFKIRGSDWSALTIDVPN
jgi:inner membrane protein